MTIVSLLCCFFLSGLSQYDPTGWCYPADQSQPALSLRRFCDTDRAEFLPSSLPLSATRRGPFTSPRAHIHTCIFLRFFPDTFFFSPSSPCSRCFPYYPACLSCFIGLFSPSLGCPSRVYLFSWSGGGSASVFGTRSAPFSHFCGWLAFPPADFCPPYLPSSGTFPLYSVMRPGSYPFPFHLCALHRFFFSLRRACMTCSTCCLSVVSGRFTLLFQSGHLDCYVYVGSCRVPLAATSHPHLSCLASGRFFSFGPAFPPVSVLVLTPRTRFLFFAPACLVAPVFCLRHPGGVLVTPLSL